MNTKPNKDSQYPEISRHNDQPTAIKFMAINTNSLQHNVRRFEIHSIVEKYKPDIVLLSETKLTSKHYLLSNTYSVIRTDRPNSKQGGGTAIMIKNNIKHKIIKYPSSNKNRILEFTIVQIFTEATSNNNIFIISGYATNSSKKIFIYELNDLLPCLDLNNLNNSFIQAGDLNARRKEWGDSDDNQRRKYLRNWEKDTLAKYRVKIYTTDEALFTPAKTYLNICITDLTISDLTSNGKITTADYDSDHRALLFTKALPSHTQQENKQNPRRNI